MKNVSVWAYVDPEDVLNELSTEQILDHLDDEDILDYIEGREWLKAETVYNKYHQSSAANLAKLDLFVSYIDDITLEQVEQLVGSKFEKGK